MRKLEKSLTTAVDPQTLEKDIITAKTAHQVATQALAKYQDSATVVPVPVPAPAQES